MGAFTTQYTAVLSVCLSQTLFDSNIYLYHFGVVVVVVVVTVQNKAKFGLFSKMIKCVLYVRKHLHTDSK